MVPFQVALVLATLLCTLVAGFLFGFAVVVMPGIATRDAGEFLRAFRAMDGIIQRNQPLFGVVWLGSVVGLVAAAVLGLGALDPTGRVLLGGATIAYLLGVQAPTFAINVPLNNRVQALPLEAMDAPALEAARKGFETRWNRSNVARTIVACLVALLLIVVALRH